MPSSDDLAQEALEKIIEIESRPIIDRYAKAALEVAYEVLRRLDGKAE